MFDRTSLDISLLGTDSDFFQPELLNNFSGDCGHRAAAGLYPFRSSQVILAPGLVELPKLVLAAKQWAFITCLARLVAAASPELLDRSVEKKGSGACCIQ
jgi:hypothetical protein